LDDVIFGHGISLLWWKSGGVKHPTICRLSDSSRHQLSAIAPLFADWAAIDPAREAAAGDAVAGVLFDPLGALLMERLEYHLLFHWFAGIGVDDAVWDRSVYSKNRDRLLGTTS
jgi:hypothetical protein